MNFGLDADARDIAEYLLERSGQALMSGDFDAMKSCFILPQSFSTYDGESLVTTIDELHRVFVDVRDEFARRAITFQRRAVLQVERISENLIMSAHLTHLFSGDVLVKKPFPVLSQIKWTGQDWRVAASEYAVEPGSSHSWVLTGKSKAKLVHFEDIKAPQKNSPEGDTK